MIYLLYYLLKLILYSLQLDLTMNNIFNDPFLDKQNIIDYERKVIQTSLQQLPKPTLSPDSRYCIWGLNQKIEIIIGTKPHNLRWIGNSSDSHIYAYAYAILMLCIQNQQAFIQLKKCLYQLSRKYLESSHQKFLIQFLYLIQFSSDKFVFLKKYPAVESILISLFKFIDQEKKINNNSDRNQKLESTKKSRQNSISKFREPAKNRSFTVEDQMIKSTQIAFIAKVTQAYTTYASIFNFISMSSIDKYSFSFHLQNTPQGFHIVNEGQCFFLLTSKNSFKQQAKKIFDKNQVNKLLQENLVKNRQIYNVMQTWVCNFNLVVNRTDQKQSNRIDQKQKIFVLKQNQNNKKIQQENKKIDNQTNKQTALQEDSEQGKIKQFMNIFQSSGYQSQIQKIQILDEKPKIYDYLSQFKSANPHIIDNKNRQEQNQRKFKFMRIKSAQSSRHNSPYQRKINKQQKLMQLSAQYKMNPQIDKNSPAIKEMNQLKLAFQKAKQKRKQEIFKIDQKYYQKKQQIIKKNKINTQSDQKQTKKMDFFSRISLKNRSDYMFGSSKNTSQFEGVGSRQVTAGKFNIYNTLSNKSQYDLRKKIIGQLEEKNLNEKQSKLSNQKIDLKRNLSHEQRLKNTANIKNPFKKVFKEDLASPQAEDQDKININVFTPGYSKHQFHNFQAAQKQLKINKANSMFQYSFGPKERAF